MPPNRALLGLIGLFLFVSAGCNEIARSSSSRAVFDVAGFGAVGDGTTLDTVAFRHAIEACRQLGGGTVRVGRGTYLLQPLDLANGMTLALDSRAVLLFSDEPEDYPLQETRWDGIMRPARRPCIAANRCRNVAIIGGTIDGAGASWWEPVQAVQPLRASERTAAPVAHPWETDPLLRRPPLVQFRDCTDVRIEGVTFRDPPMNALHLLFCSDVTIRASKFNAPENAPGTDGVNIDSTSNVLIENCSAQLGGDAFALRSGKDDDGRRIGRATSGVTIRGCTIKGGVGAIAIGSDMSGGVRGVRIDNCRIDLTDVGVAVRSTRGRGGAVQGVRVTNLAMSEVGSPFTISMRHRPTAAEPVTVRTPAVSGVTLSGITVRDAARAGIIEGLEEMPVRALSFRNLNITARYGISCSWADDVEFRDMIIATDFGPAILRTDTTNLRLDNWSEATRAPQTQPAMTVVPSTQPATRPTTRP